MKLLSRTALCSALALALSSCGEAPQAVAANAAAPAETLTEAQLVEAIAADLQACSYDGTPVAINVAGLRMGVNADGRDVVSEIMKFTGLPPNFDVVEHPEVPNAAAVILLGPDKLPKRVIAYNPKFMRDVRAATANNDWAPISIMAHEIGHHLSGHTIQPGGSQPPTELEADKFSGYVLYKMGALLADAQKAMNTLVPETDGKTHPGRGKRVRAIEDGWRQACTQQGGACDGAVVAAAPARSAPGPAAPSAPKVATSASAPAAPLPTAGQPLVASAGQVDTLPVPDANATPAKFDKFIYDETGLLDATWRAKFEKEMYEHASQWGVEIVTLLVDDLHGLSGDEYAQAMMRQLRVGKLDVGNGAVLVVAPKQGQVGVAMGSGLALEMRYSDKSASLQRWLDAGWPECRRKQACGQWTENFMGASDHIRRDTDAMQWTIRYQTLADTMQAHEAANRERAIARFTGTVVKRDPPTGNKAAWVSEISLKHGRRAVQVQGEGGYTVVLYVDPATEARLPAGALKEGEDYVFIGRVQDLSWNARDTQSFNVLSYDLAN